MTKVWEDNFKHVSPILSDGIYAYYEEDDPIVSDAEYDTICRMLDENWDTVEHSHKWCVNKEDLKWYRIFFKISRQS